MTIKTILAPISGGIASKAAFDLACQLAVSFRAHVEGLHVVAVYGGALIPGGEGALPPLATSEFDVPEAAAKRASESLSLFEEVVADHNLVRDNVAGLAFDTPSAAWREEKGYAPILIARRARFFDLVVLGRSDRVVGEPYTDTIEETLLRSGRPILVAPAELTPHIGHVVAVAWNGSPEAVRALTSALPLLERAERAWLLTVGTADGSEEALNYLRWHGIDVRHRNIAEPGHRHIGRVLLDNAVEIGADLAVMGGYSRAPLRELIFGGATRDAVGFGAMPVLLMH